MQYKHYKGGIYEFVFEAKYEPDPDVIMIVYKSVDGSIWTRRKDVFFESVEHEGDLVPRFSPIN